MDLGQIFANLSGVPHQNLATGETYEPMSKKKLSDEQLETLKKLLIAGNKKVYGTTERPSRTTTRRIRLFIAVEAGEIREITRYLEHRHRMDKNDRIMIGGGGFCAVHHVVDDLMHVTGMNDLRYERL